MPKKSATTQKTAEISAPEEQLRGYIEHIIFPSWGRESKNGFAILAVRLVRNESNRLDSVSNQADDSNRVVVKGIMPHPKVGDEVMFKGHWVNDPKYGRQFNFNEFEVILPTSKQGIVAYFSSDQFYGLGRVAAEKIIAALGDNCLNLLKENPALAYEIPGLSEKQKHELAEKMAEHNALGDLIALICRHGIGTGMAGRIYAHYGPRALDVVKENPYQLTKDIDGIGFLKADAIGEAVGIKKDSEFRIQAAIRHILEEAKNEGHVAMRSAKITKAVLKLLGPGSGVKDSDVARVGLGMIESGELRREKDDEKNIDLIYLNEMWAAEVYLANKIREMVNSYEESNVKFVEELVDSLEESMGKSFKLAPEQRRAIIMALTNKISVVTGGPGTGKSTITKLIVSGYESLNPTNNVYLVAPTGRAAKRLAEATGREAKTIHRLLKYTPGEGFMYDDFTPLPGPGLLIIDEASMMDIELAYALFRAVPEDMQVVIIGDVDQLPSVGPGAVLRDIIYSGVVPTTRLKYIYRQEEGSTISLLADMINRYDESREIANLRNLEEMCEGKDFQFIEVETPEEAHLAIKNLMEVKHSEGLNIMDFMVLTPLKSRGAACAESLNTMLRDIFNPAGEEKQERNFGNKLFRDRDKVMKVNRNDYRKLLFNGDIGILRLDEKGIVFNMDGNGTWIDLETEDLATIELAYAFTIHKSQGGEAPFVPVVCIKSHWMGGRILTRNLLYTAITRAKKKLILVGSQEAFEMAVKNNRIEKRYGLLKERLRGEV